MSGITGEVSCTQGLSISSQIQVKCLVCICRLNKQPDLMQCLSFFFFLAKEAFEKGQTPIIIDNTNMQCWEMKPYVAMVSSL